MIKSKFLLVVMLAIAFLQLTGCIQYPTEKQSVVDQRPRISFRFAEDNMRLSEARVFVDSLDSGRMGDYIDGKNALRVLPGMHTIQIQNGPETILNERVYLGDGVSRPFNVQ